MFISNPEKLIYKIKLNKKMGNYIMKNHNISPINFGEDDFYYFTETEELTKILKELSFWRRLFLI